MLPESLEPASLEVLEPWMPRAQRYLLAVSGGRDSMVLWHFLRAMGYSDLVICHVNHLLRGEGSHRDENFVREHASHQGDPFQTVQVDVAAQAKELGVSIEQAARDVRYDWFAKISNDQHCPHVILGHHADDQVETVVMNVFRGTGLRGLGGMEPVSTRNFAAGELLIFRPMLAIFREAINEYAEKHGIPYMEDESNREDFALRNRVRHSLMPVVHDVFRRDVRSSLLRMAALSRLDQQWIDDELDGNEAIAHQESIEVAPLRELPAALRNRLIQQWLRNRGVSDCGFDEVVSVAEIAMSSGRPAKVNLPGNLHARRREGVLFLEKGETK